MPVWCWVALGSGIGGGLRFMVEGLGHELWDFVFPWPTLFINASGCFAIGLLAALAGPLGHRPGLPARWRHFLMTGVCGGYTTFSMLSLETLVLFWSHPWLGVGNLLLTAIVCLAAVALGYWLGFSRSSSPE